LEPTPSNDVDIAAGTRRAQALAVIVIVAGVGFAAGYIVRGGHRFTLATDANLLSEAIAALEQRLERAPWRTHAKHDAFTAPLEKANAVYDAIAWRNTAPGRPTR
jgi:hypothetical protein